MLLGNLLFRTAQQFGARPSFDHGGQAFCWDETLDRVRRVARALADAGVERIAILGHNSIEYHELTFAAGMAGVAFVPLNTRLADAELEALLGQAGPGLLFADAAHLARAAALARAVPAVRQVICWDAHAASAAGVTGYASLLACPPADPAAVPADRDWAIVFTGGTTGLPKGVRVPRAGFTFNLQHILRDLAWGGSPRFLQVTPLFHLAALGPAYAVTAWGGCHYLLPQFDLEAMLDMLARHRIETVALVPTMIGWLVRHPRIADYALHDLRAIGYGASGIQEPVLRRALELFPGLKFNQFYGQTESSGGLATLAPEDHDLARPHLLTSAGRPLIGVRLGIFDEAGHELPRGAWGEICARSPGLFAGYLAHPEQTRAALRGGWLRTGDIGYLDDEGFLHVTDRLKDMIVTGGENVSSSEVENAIASHPGVAQVAVVAAPDPEWGERVHAFVRRAAGGAVSRDELVAHCRTRIAGYKCPKTIDFLDEDLPLSAVGKIRKDVLRARIGAVTPTGAQID